MTEEINKPTRKKVLSVICTVLTVLIALLAVIILVNVIVSRIRNKPVSFFGTSFAIVLTGSMEPDIMTGDLIIFRECDYSDVQVGDVIVFVGGESFGELKGQSIVHQAIEITEDGIRTKGTNNNIADQDFVTGDNLLGKCVAHSAFWGAVFSFLSKYAILLIVALIAVPFIISQIVKIVRLSRNGDNEEEAGGVTPVPTENVSEENNDKNKEE